MHSIESIYETVNSLESSSVYELYEILEIEIHYTPLMITHNRDSMIISDGTYTGVFIRPNTDAKYVEFLLWHELGHYMLHYNPDLKMNYQLSTFRDRFEQQANVFAVLAILKHVDLADRNPVEVSVEHGVPRVVAADVIRQLAENKYRLK